VSFSHQISITNMLLSLFFYPFALSSAIDIVLAHPYSSLTLDLEIPDPQNPQYPQDTQSASFPNAENLADNLSSRATTTENKQKNYTIYPKIGADSGRNKQLQTLLESFFPPKSSSLYTANSHIDIRFWRAPLTDE